MTTAVQEQLNLSLRHANATLAYRAAVVLRDVPAGFSGTRAGDGSRSAGEILAHLGDLLDWALSMAKGKEAWQDSTPKSWSADSKRFHASLTAFDKYLSSGAELHTSPEKLFQGAVADALTHVGQIALLRRLAGAPIASENYCEAKIEVGRTGADQIASASSSA